MIFIGDKMQFHAFGNSSVRQRSDGFVSATDMCKEYGRTFTPYGKLVGTKTQVSTLTEEIGCNPVQIERGGTTPLRGTWVHPLLAVSLARWLDSAAATVVIGWVAPRVITPAPPPVTAPAPPPVATITIITTTTTTTTSPSVVPVTAPVVIPALPPVEPRVTKILAPPKVAAREKKARQEEKAREEKAREEKARQETAREETAREEKARQEEKAREETIKLAADELAKVEQAAKILEEEEIKKQKAATEQKEKAPIHTREMVEQEELVAKISEKEKIIENAVPTYDLDAQYLVPIITIIDQKLNATVAAWETFEWGADRIIEACYAIGEKVKQLASAYPAAEKFSDANDNAHDTRVAEQWVDMIMSREKTVTEREKIVAMREETVAVREKIVAMREETVAVREKIVAMREETVAARENYNPADDELFDMDELT